jgi:hypothetical protein
MWLGKVICLLPPGSQNKQQPCSSTWELGRFHIAQIATIVFHGLLLYDCAFAMSYHLTITAFVVPLYAGVWAAQKDGLMALR